MNKKRNLIVGGIAALLLIAFFTNPDQAAHLTALQQIVKLRKPDRASSINNALMPNIHYDNYLLFSSTTVGNATLTYGYFGQMQTTDGIETFFQAYAQLEAEAAAHTSN